MGSCLSLDARESPYSPSTPNEGSKTSLGSWSSFSFNSKEDSQLHRRKCLNGGSSISSLFTQQGKKGVNQDAMIVWENFGSRIDTIFCGVFDGHGPFGHMVAKKVRDSLPSKLNAYWDVSVGSDNLKESSISTEESMNSEETASLPPDEELASMNSQEKEKFPETLATLKDSFLKAFRIMDKELSVHPSIDCFCSGTTAVTLVKQGQDLVIGNIGDSRAVLGTRDKDNSLIAVQLTVDLKPDLPGEEERIRQCKGRVFALDEESTVARIWLPDNDSPGLAMARAFGDFCLKDFGLISVPEISYRHITERDEFVVLATDGIWDVLSNKEVVEIVASAPTQSFAAQYLVEAAVRSWRHNYPSSKMDDCAVVCLFLNADTSSSPVPHSGSKELVKSSPDFETGKEGHSFSTLKRSGTLGHNFEILHGLLKEYKKRVTSSMPGKKPFGDTINYRGMRE